MVTAYYIMKMSKSNRTTDINEYYNTLYKTNIKTLQHIKNRVMCRVCLKEGVVPIFEIEESSDALEILSFFGDIEINREDKLPKHLCAICYKFVKSAILFKKVAKLSEESLKNPIKQEIIDSSTDNQDKSEDNKESVKTWPVSIASRNERKCILKMATKVQCYICNTVVNKSYYKEHLTMHDPNHHKYVCDICGKSFRLRCAYHNHSLRHGTGFPFKCQLCPYKGKYAELLKTHMRTHTGDYRYMCTECPARFLFKSNLNSHVLNKHKEKKHKCDACKRAFHTKLALQRHFEVDHLGIKSHVCNVCGNAFGYRNAMMKHQRRVHKREKMMFSRMPSYLQAEDKLIETPSS